MALKHKNLEFELINLKLRNVSKEISDLTNGAWNRVPVLKRDDGQIVYDSDTIATYLEQEHPDKPLLFPNGNYYNQFLQNYMFSMDTFKCAILDIYDNFEDKEDKEYFKSSREGMFKVSLEKFAGNREELLPNVDLWLAPFRGSLAKYKFLEGEKATYSDFLLFGSIKSLQISSKFLFEYIVVKSKDESIKKWFEAIQALYDGYAKKADP
ncbi:hypothetical protein K502DRAFT_324596 [Neoconidiobolus thromboides FSU 785]|nr:hypothetical protein K502DRAFT_324596 [Neoconidiobolus thromboides FSU 785]